jgi:hypothetical protein
MHQQPTLPPTTWFIGCQRVGCGEQVAYIGREGWLPRSIRREARDLIAHSTTDRPEQRPRFVSTPQSTPISAAVWRGYRSVCVTMENPAGKNDAAGAAFRLQLSALQHAQQAVWALLRTIDD